MAMVGVGNCAKCPLLEFCVAQRQDIAAQRDDLLPLAPVTIAAKQDIPPALYRRMQVFGETADSGVRERAKTIVQAIGLVAREGAPDDIKQEAVFRVLGEQEALFQQVPIAAVQACRMGVSYYPRPPSRGATKCNSLYKEQIPRFPDQGEA